MGNTQQIRLESIFFIKKLLSCCLMLIEIDSYILQQLRNGANIPYFHIVIFLFIQSMKKKISADLE